jgi:hypothetical protein
MKPKIADTSFGSIKVGKHVFEHDIIIRLDGRVEKRKKKLSKSIFGTSHTLSLDEIKYVYEPGAEGLIIGTGQSGMVKLSPEASGYLQEQGCPVTLLPTPQAAEAWNAAQGALIGLFHITC